jgi:DNA polymerase-1
LTSQGVRLDEVIVHPQITVRTVTGRVTYAEPALQTLPKEQRLTRISPIVPGRIFVRADFGQIEPRIVLELLHRQGWLPWTPGDDVYLDLIEGVSVTRDEAKKLVNTIINGGRCETNPGGRLVQFIRTTERYRSILGPEAKEKGYVETLAGRRIELATDEPNHGGKAVNRVVQGTAADIFNNAVVAIDRAIRERNLPATVALLVYDEVWVEVDPGCDILPLIRKEMEAAAQALGVFVPVR